MDDDWDLHAVVRGFTATGTTINTANNNYFTLNSSSNYTNENNSSFDFHGLVDERNVDSFQGLHEIYQSICVDPPPPAAATMSTPVTQVLQPQYEMVNMQPPTQMNLQMQENVQLMNPSLISAPVISYPVTNSQPIRPRRRKNQQAKMVHQVTDEELSADSWAWRKYGQKRIKGSPYPRNYYRCSTSKGCAARKHVERSLDDPNIFLVTYTGEHTHPRPSNRTSLTGIARNRLAAAKNNNNNNNNNSSDNNSSSPIVSNSTISPSTPLVADGSAAVQNNNDMQMVVEEEHDTNIMNIPHDNNYMYDENIVNGFHQDLLTSPIWNSTTF